MSKQDFLDRLRKGLYGLPQDEIDERLTFYSEMIDDRIEEGLSQEDAVAAVGSVEEIVAQVIAETPFTKIAKERIKPKRQLKAWQIVLLVLGAPLWLSLGIAAISAGFSLYVSLWSAIVSLWAVFGATAISSLSSLAAGIIFILCGDVLSGVAMIAAGLVCAGLSIFMFFGCKAITQGTVFLTKKFALWIKNCFIQKEDS